MNHRSNPNFLFFISTLILTSLIAVRTFSQPFSLERTFDDPSPSTAGNGDLFGLSVMLDGNRLLIGAPHDDTIGTDVGQAYLFDANNGNMLQSYDDPTATGNFGASAVINGNRVLVGGSDAGPAMVYLFDATGGNVLHTFDDPNVTEEDDFGHSVALDGNRVLIGDSRDHTNGIRVGQAYLFDAISGDLLHTFDDPTPSDRDHFGWSVALDGEHVLIGAPSDNTHGSDIGQAHLFDATNGNLLRTFDDPTVTDGDRFGHSVALNGDSILIGAPNDETHGNNVGQAHLFDAASGNLLQTFDDPTVTDRDRFGRSVALNGDSILIGAPYDETHGNDVGQAHLFDAASGNLLQTFDDPTVTVGDRFGSSVALNGHRFL